MKRFVFLLIISIFVLPTVGLAQIGPAATDVNVDMTPENPRANDIVNVSLTSYLTNIDAANITWKVNGKIIQSGIGNKNFQFQVGDMDTGTLLEITIITKEGFPIRKTFNIRPAEVDLYWQTDGYTPPFYKGKALFSHQNKITFIAIPHIVGAQGEIDAKNLIYKWTDRGDVVDNASGYGKNTYSITGSIISRPLSVEVEVSSPGNDGVAYNRITINPIEPKVFFYEKNPLYGILFQKRLQGSITMNNSEIEIFGAPLFFSSNNNAVNAIYKWSINGSSINDGYGSQSHVFRNETKSRGTANVALSVEQVNKVLQFAEESLSLTLDEK